MVWCLQLVMVINRFLFEITQIDGNKNVFFVNDKTQRTQSAINFFVVSFVANKFQMRFTKFLVAETKKQI